MEKQQADLRHLRRECVALRQERDSAWAEMQRVQVAEQEWAGRVRWLEAENRELQTALEGKRAVVVSSEATVQARDREARQLQHSFPE